MLALMNINGAILGYENATLTFEGTYGEGIARYIQDPSGQNEDAALEGVSCGRSAGICEKIPGSRRT